MPKKRDFLARIGAKLDIPREALPGGFGLFMSGQNEIIVRGYRKILRYGREEIELSLGKTRLNIEGEDLFCTLLTAESVTICGNIHRLTFCAGEEYAH